MRHFVFLSTLPVPALLFALLVHTVPLAQESRRLCEVAPVMKCLDKAKLEGTTLKVPQDAVAIKEDGIVICDSSFNYTTAPDMVLIMDNTGSMDRIEVRDGIPRYCTATSPEPSDTACISGDPQSLRGPALKSFLDSAVVKGGKGMNAGVVTFAESILGGTEALQPLTASTLETVKSSIVMNPGGQTNYTAAFREAYRLLKSSRKPKSEQFIIFVSDGRPNLPKQGEGGPYLYKDFMDTLIAVHSIFLGANTAGSQDMQDIAKSTKGLFFNITDVRLLAGILTNDISKKLFRRATPSYTIVSNLSTQPQVRFEIKADGHKAIADSGAYTLDLPGPVQLRKGINEIVLKTEYGYEGTTQDVHFKIERTAEGPFAEWTQSCREPAALRLYNADDEPINVLGLPFQLRDSVMKYSVTTAAAIDSFDLDVRVTSPVTAQFDLEGLATGPSAKKDSTWTSSAAFQHQRTGKNPGDGALQVDHGETLIATYRHPFIPEDSAQARVRIKYGPDFARASYHDLDGDGRIETVRIRWLEELKAVPAKLQFTVVDPQGTHERIAEGGEIKYASKEGGGDDREALVVTLANPFPKGVTSLSNADSSGRTFRQNDVPVMDGRFRVDDSVAPAILSAVVKGPDKDNVLSRVLVTYSEPVKIADLAAEPIVFKRDTVTFDRTQIPITRAEKVNGSEREWTFHLGAGATFTPVGGDSVAINDNGETRDLAGRAPKTLVFTMMQGGSPGQSISGFFVTFPNGSKSEAAGVRDVSLSGNGFIPVDSRGYPMPGNANGKCQSCNPGVEGGFGGAVITVISKQPVNYEFSIYTNLGVLVARAKGKVEEADFPLLEKIEPAGGSKDPNEVKRVQRIIWTGYSTEGQAVGTGVYVLKAIFKYEKSFKTGAKASENTRITRFGFLRSCCKTQNDRWYY